ncbi:DNA cytosine methyltransferase [Flammeovirga sp. SubArs3]|uniref:DNA cytosine methyltransferase n=1 Tax=Flammeovirga sp. SubArs3 TaxID=2995316 RepID=UPI00248B8A68|nr:DNA cytosine methyltransferase [Flammeovirga sp. SubArs3]
MAKKYTYIDLFSGAGGLSIGFGNQGFNLEIANDIAKPALDTLKYNTAKYLHPDMNLDRIIHGDIIELYEHLGVGLVEQESQGHKVIKTMAEENLRKKAPSVKDDDDINEILSEITSVDVLVGGPPCQGFSMIGRSKKATLEERANGFIDDPRNQLFKYYLKFAEKLSPKLVLIENVKGLASASGYRDLIEETLRKTGNLGYNVHSEILNAKDYGIPQNRERIFFIGVRNDLVSKDITAKHIFDLLLNEKVEKELTLEESIFDLPQIEANPKPNNYDSKKEIAFGKRHYFGENISKGKFLELIELDRSSNYRNEINSYNGELITPEHLFNHKSRYNNERDLFIYKHLVEGKYLNDPVNKKALSKVTYGVSVDKDGNKAVRSFGDKYFKLNSKGVSKTIIAHLETDGNSYVHPGEKPRSITPREAARIQSFPDWYFFTGSTRNQFKQIGNAVPPLLASKIAKQFKTVLDSLNK